MHSPTPALMLLHPDAVLILGPRGRNHAARLRRTPSAEHRRVWLVIMDDCGHMQGKTQPWPNCGSSENFPKSKPWPRKRKPQFSSVMRAACDQIFTLAQLGETRSDSSHLN